jgi:hypothetical protein
MTSKISSFAKVDILNKKKKVSVGIERKKSVSLKALLLGKVPE